jgi:glucosamine-6-phosphate deaminase
MTQQQKTEKPVRVLQAGNAQVEIYSSKAAQGQAAAARGAELIRDAINQQGHARIIIATGNSQKDMVAALGESHAIDWKRVEVFHMDEYLGMTESHPASFRRWLRENLSDRVHAAQFHLLKGDAADVQGEILRYERLLLAAPVEVCFLGIGENGHIAFNDPHIADFNDPVTVKIVALDERCRKQQVGEGHFATLDDVPRQALTLTCPGLMRAQNLICCVPEARKAQAVRNALEGEITYKCPGSMLRTHPRATIYLDLDSASQLSIPDLARGISL